MISVCMASYNGEKYIKEQIDSILKQLSDEDELVISDDGSTDNTLSVIQSIHDKRIKLIHNQGEHGYSRNFENALKNSKGDYIFLSDQDDVWKDNKVETILPLYGIQFNEIKRYEVDGEIISDSKVRLMLKYKQFEKIKQYVPQTTLDYLLKLYREEEG